MKQNILDQRFRSNTQFPGQAIGMTKKEVQNQYTTQCKIYGQNINLTAGNNPAIDINLPRDGRKLIGISVYYSYENAVNNPLTTLNINNTIFIDSVGFRTFDLTNLRERMFYPLDIALSGNDRITLDVNLVTINRVANFNFHYV